MEEKIKEIVSHFKINGDFISFKKIITGHINDSYLIETSAKEHPGYFLQWINSFIFNDVDGLMNNISAVTNHLAEKLAVNKTLDFKVLEIIPSTDGNKYYVDDEGQYWRMYTYISNMHSYDFVENTTIAYEGEKHSVCL